MPPHIAQCTIDATDLDLMTRFWSAALGYDAGPEQEGGTHLFGAPGAPSVFLQRVATPGPAAISGSASGSASASGSGSGSATKNRVHLDLLCDGDVEAEVVRLVGLGARPTDVGQTGAEPFTVLADPEGNAFCLLHVDPRNG